MELVEIDRNLEGFVSYEDLSFCLLKSGVAYFNKCLST